MEVGIDERLPIYSGGLGVLAGDTLRSLADLGIPALGLSLLYRKGYFRQEIDAHGNQIERPFSWNPADVLTALETTIRVTIARRPVNVRAWLYDITGMSGHVVPLILLDTDVPENDVEARTLTDFLYGGDARYRLAQEIVLGVGGVRMLEKLGYSGIDRYHMNEGHASLLALELLGRERTHEPADGIRRVREKCVFTTHTPVPAGHDQFSWELVSDVLGEALPIDQLRALGGKDRLNMTLLALNLSHYVNGVARRHGEVSQRMFPGYTIDSITNGVHSFRWTSEPFRNLYDRHIPGWARDPFALRNAIKISGKELWQSHTEAKARLLDEVRRRTARSLKPETFTIGFARRATAWKRADLVLSDRGRLLAISGAHPLQLVFAGKAHPKDAAGKSLIQKIVRTLPELGPGIDAVYLDDYDVDLARTILSGVDLLLNTPLRPLEASGTSGMKSALNGVPSLSILDGWWIEGHIEGVTGWSIGTEEADEAPETESDNGRDAAELYDKLEKKVLPLYYENRDGWIDVMRHTIAVNASFFSAHRMVLQYAATAYV
jgi:starch phosphorylase